MKLDLDTEDRFVQYKMGMTCIMQLVDGQDQLSRIEPQTFGCLLHIMHDFLDEAVPLGGRPPRAVNDLDGV